MSNEPPKPVPVALEMLLARSLAEALAARSSQDLVQAVQKFMAPMVLWFQGAEHAYGLGFDDSIPTQFALEESETFQSALVRVLRAGLRDFYEQGLPTPTNTDNTADDEERVVATFLLASRITLELNEWMRLMFSETINAVGDLFKAVTEAQGAPKH